ncbi:MAG: hypothetical protein ACTSRG_00460 [Candidatus Helarchaeota archaeon]
MEDLGGLEPPTSHCLDNLRYSYIPHKEDGTFCILGEYSNQLELQVHFFPMQVAIY